MPGPLTAVLMVARVAQGVSWRNDRALQISKWRLVGINTALKRVKSLDIEDRSQKQQDKRKQTTC
jgi:hypothetical protein